MVELNIITENKAKKRKLRREKTISMAVTNPNRGRGGAHVNGHGTAPEPSRVLETTSVTTGWLSQSGQRKRIC